ncbi:hypothetical protein [Arthrobacter sp. ISL-65]|uniref:hypothetical protein n=1 Tax=Arthrobacter sp. ISL-65 TaxID=2819112 RepID=UPI001BECF4D3|nr:hypothetical protein [Arthrobacter sp. ISL-65]MBT2547220.1 hypothetical protein [Arthrobacter sp. ISL-65]
MREAKLLVQIGWICHAIVSLAILVFGLVLVMVPTGEDPALYRADGLASTGLGLFGALIVLIPYRRMEQWAWWALWFYPVFWAAHLFGNLPPGNDHIHQVVFIALSLVGIVLPVRVFFGPTQSPRGAGVPGGKRTS